MAVRQRKIAPKTMITTEAGLASMERYPQHKGAAREYRVYPRELDALPIDTFLIEAEIGTGGYPLLVARIVKPNDPSKKEYRGGYLTPEKRLLYVCWQNGRAVHSLKKLTMQGSSTLAACVYRYIIMPGMAGFEELEGFKTLCEIKRRWSPTPPVVDTTLLCRAVGWQGPGLT